MTTIVTLDEHLKLENNKFNTNINYDIPLLLNDILISCKIIQNEISKIGLTSQTGFSGAQNIHGEHTQKLDLYTNDIIKSILTKHGRYSVLGSEEEDDIVLTGSPDAKYTILFDPLDGSSNIDVNVSVGTIFSIYKNTDGSTGSLKDCLQPGSKQLAAGYILYGSSTMFVYTAGNGTHGFTFDPAIGEFFLSHKNIKIPDKHTCYSINDALWHSISPELQKSLQQFRNITKISARYVGSLVADFHRNLLKGGIYLYPGTLNKPNGKLRLLYEANPLAFICEQAGGYSTNGKESILNLVPSELHQRVPLFIGNKDLVDMISI